MSDPIPLAPEPFDHDDRFLQDFPVAPTSLRGKFNEAELESLITIVAEVFNEIGPDRLDDFLSETQMVLGQRAYTEWSGEDPDALMPNPAKTSEAPTITLHLAANEFEVVRIAVAGVPGAIPLYEKLMAAAQQTAGDEDG